MSTSKKRFARLVNAALLILAACLVSAGVEGPSAAAQTTATESVLYAFCPQGGNSCANGENPNVGLIQGSDGNFYGTTSTGGSNNNGTVFKITPSGTLTTLYNFCSSQSNCLNGSPPSPNALIQGSDGNFYGTTSGYVNNDGTVFKITPTGTLTTLYSFCSQSNCPVGDNPAGALVQGSDGNFYGTTVGGGNGLGTIFKITPSGTFTTLYNFCSQTNCTDGEYPSAGLIQGSDGNFYGTTEGGGVNSGGTIFKITPTGTLTTLSSFCGQSSPSQGNCAEGGYPQDALVQGSDGNFYGTTLGADVNTIFKITPTGTLTTLYSFCSQGSPGSNCPDGYDPYAGLIQGSDGNFYGTTVSGGGGNGGGGVIFTLSLLPALTAPVQLSFSTPQIDLGDSSTLSWQVLNGASTTLQQCYAFVQNAATGAGTWTGLQTGTASNGVYSGSTVITPTADGTYTYALTCGGAESGFATLTVGAAQPLTITTSSLAAATAGTGYSQTLTATGGAAPYTWSISSGSLPDGLTLSTVTGIISGTPISAGDSSFVVEVQDSESTPQTAKTNLNISVLPVAAAPTFSPPAGAYTSAQSVTISDATSGATIYYAINATPTTSSTAYTGPITVSSTETIEAIAVASGYSNSAVATATYTISTPTATTPTFSPVAGTYTSAQTVTISDATSGATIYYTTNGTTPTTGSTVYTAPITVSSSETIEAIAAASGYASSAVAQATYIISATQPTAGEIVTFAGDGTQGYTGDGGLATAAELHFPIGVAVDASGNVYVADGYNYVIRKVAATTGIITTVAGNGAQGYSGDGGPATEAELALPTSVAVDAAGNLYIADEYNERVRKVTASTGIITTVAGDGTQGYSGDGGLATGAELNYPAGVAVDTAGNLYIGALYNNAVREVTASTGIISTVAGDGTAGYSGDGGFATAAELDGPAGVVLDAAGNLYIADTYSNVIRKVTASTGIISTVAGNGTEGFSGDGGPATAAEMYYPSAVAVDTAGNLYVADSQNSAIRYVAASTGIMTTVAGNGTAGYSGDGGPATAAELAYPPGVAVDGAGDLYIADFSNSRVREVYGPVGTLPPASTPTFSPAAGTYTAAQTVTITDGTSGATIYYTTDGSTPTTSSTVYSGPITVSASETIEAMATASGYSQSAVASAVYTITTEAQTATPTLSPGAGTYNAATVAISDATPGATIYYTTNETTPTTSSTVYDGPIVVSSTETIEAIASASGYSPSAAAQATYTISSSASSGAEWAWMGGSSTVPCSGSAGAGGFCGQSGTYGVLGSPAAANLPGGRDSAVSWTDSSGNFWAFGGEGFDSAGTWGILNDLWKFDASLGQWVWMGGSSTVPGFAQAPPGVYGTLGTPTSGNIPMGRENANAWKDRSGNFWLFGGLIDNGSTVFDDLNDLWEFSPSTGQWTWVAGNESIGTTCYQYPSYFDFCGRAGVYGTLGTPSSSNIPGSRDSSVTWTDKQGNLWLFGGEGEDSAGNFGFLNDLWVYNPTTNQSAWMGGSSTVPAIDDGQPGIYGTLGTPAAGNTPGSRYGALGWTDSSGDFWLFGGYGFDSAGNGGSLNDLWEYNPTTNEWAWMGGSSTVAGATAVYGSMGVAAPGNIPGGREYAQTWTDAGGNFWLFGGYSFDSVGNGELLNDLWEFNPTTNEWAWMGGSSAVNPNGVYGLLSVPAAGNTPGGRYSPVGWVDGADNLWLFGGGGYDSADTYGELNDLWEYTLSTIAPAAAATPAFSPAAGTYTSAQTVTISDATSGATIYYTTDGSTPTTSSTVYSGPITVSASETIEAMATASGYSQSAVASAVYTITTEAQTATPTFSPAAGTYTSAQTVTISDATPGATIYYTTNGTTPTTSSTVYSGPITASSTATIEAIATASGYLTSAVASAAYTISILSNPVPALAGLSPAFISSGGSAFTLTITGTGFISSSTVYWGATALTTTYVSATQLTAQVPAGDIASSGTTAITVQSPSPGGGTSNTLEFEIDSGSSGSGPTFTTVTATVAPGSTATYSVTLPSGASDVTVLCLNLPAGASCSYSSSTNQVTIATSSSTPAGTYQITVVFTETLPGAAAGLIILPILLLPLAYARRKRAAVNRVWLMACVTIVLTTAALVVGCGGGSSGGGGSTTSQTQAVTTSGEVTLTVQ